MNVRRIGSPGKRIALGATLVASVALVFPAPEARGQEPSPSALAVAGGLPDGIAKDSQGRPFIANIARFLNTCPQNDPATAKIRAAFQLRHNGVVVGSIPCSEPVSALPVAQYTDELVLLQGLRVAYYMDYGRTGHLPWTPGTLYDWMRSRIGGFNINDAAAYNYCCDLIDGQWHVVLTRWNAFNRNFDKRWRGIAGNLDLYGHEVRHVDGFPHIVCGQGHADDMNYDVNDLTTRGVQWWLNKLWLQGGINVGFACASPATAQETARWHLDALDLFRDSFCNVRPPALAMPQRPGGRCSPAITRAGTSGSRLTLHGPNFRSGARILLKGRWWSATRSGDRLTSATAGGRIAPGTQVIIQVKNPDGTLSPKFLYRRPPA